MRSARFALRCGAFFAVVVSAHAQVRPDAGSTQRDLEQRPLEVPRATPPIRTEPARPALKADEAQRFTVVALRVSGNTVFASEVLLTLVRDELIGRSVTLKELQQAAAKVTAYYRARGYMVARAYIPAQRIAETGAEVEIAVLEGVLGKLSVENRSRLSDAAVARFTAPLQAGVLLALDTFERPILLLSDQAGVGGVNPVLKAGEQAGGSDLTLELAPAPVASGRLELDNHGNRFTGANRLMGQINLASAFGLGETLSARFTDSFSGLTSATLYGAVPLGGNGWKIGATYSDTRYRLGRDFAVLNASGEVRATSAFVSYPWVRSQRWNLNATLAADAKRFEDRIGSASTVTPKKTDAASFTLGGDVRDPLAADSVFVWDVTTQGGRLSIDEPGALAADAATAMTQGSYRKFNVSLLYQQALSRQWTLYASLTAQSARKNLDSSEKFSLGGAQGVRAYPVGEAAGDEGRLATGELRYALPEWLGAAPSVVFFVDSGRVRINKNPFSAGANKRGLGAAGVGFTLIKGNDYAVRSYLAVKATGTAATADTDRSSRVWLSAAKYF
jgi:hemolysin activation/secretion protein